jgi:hypothetical protein
VLIKSFKSFYTGIGNNNIGIWVGSSIGRFDVEESKKLCDDYDLSYNEGPYLIVSKDNPLSRATIADDVVINFDGVNPERIQYILNEIEQDIRKGEYNKKGKIESYKQFVISQYDNHKEVIKDIAREIADILRSYTKS